VTKRIREAPERLVTRAAIGITRRRFIRRGGEVALGAAMAGAFLDRLASPAFAAERHCFGHDNINCGLPNDPNQCEQGPCGPSPPCGDNHCRNDGECADYQQPDHHTRNRAYKGDDCAGAVTDDMTNCWCSCLGGGNGMHRCCDCCQENQPSPPGDHCMMCPWTGWKCTCSAKVADNC
jgi:hypothetical protein